MTCSASNYVLVTGATGFIGAHIVDELLCRGLKVRAAARSQSKANQMIADRPQHKGRLDFVFIDDLTRPGVFDSAVKNVDAVIHTASVSTDIYRTAIPVYASSLLIRFLFGLRSL